MNLVVLICDQLPASFLGAYANTWLDTPEVDRLAAESFLFDFAEASTLDLGVLYPHVLWRGWHPLVPPPMDRVPLSLPRLLDQHGFHTVLASDDPAVLAAGEPEFVELNPILDARDGRRTADRLEETQLAHFFTEAVDALQACQQESPWRPYALWLHTRGLAPPWDAPASIRDKFCEEDEARSERMDFAASELPRDFDPDLRLEYQQAFASQTTVLDQCLGAFLELIREPAAGEPPLLVFASPRGMALGEHRLLGMPPDAVFGELLQTPLLFRFPDARGAGLRSGALVQPQDLPGTLAALLGLPPLEGSPLAGSVAGVAAGEAERIRDFVVAASGSRISLRTAYWRLDAPHPDFPAAPGSAPARLYVKPDDRWEISDVASRCRDVVEAGTAFLRALLSAAAAGGLASPPPVPEVLLSPPR